MYENTLVNLSNGGQLLTVMSGGQETVAAGGVLQIDGTMNEGSGATKTTAKGIGTLTVAAGITSVAENVGTLHRTIITLTGLVVSTTDNTTNGAQGHQTLYTFPRGNILFLGGSTNLTTLGDGVGVAATAAVVGAVGSVAPATDATLTSTEADFIPSTAGTLTASAGVLKGRGVTSKYFDNTTTTNATQLAANLNLAVPDAGTSANGSITVTGTIELLWLSLGDN